MPARIPSPGSNLAHPSRARGGSNGRRVGCALPGSAMPRATHRGRARQDRRGAQALPACRARKRPPAPTSRAMANPTAPRACGRPCRVSVSELNLHLYAMFRSLPGAETRGPVEPQLNAAIERPPRAPAARHCRPAARRLVGLPRIRTTRSFPAVKQQIARDAAAGDRWAKRVVAARIFEDPGVPEVAQPVNSLAGAPLPAIAVSAQPAKARKQTEHAAQEVAGKRTRRRRRSVGTPARRVVRSCRRAAG